MSRSNDRPEAVLSCAARQSPRRSGALSPPLVASALLAPALIASVLCAPSGGQLEPRTGAPETVADVPAGAWTKEQAHDGWIVIETRSYQLQSRIDRERSAALGKHLEELLALYRELLPSPSRSERLVVKLLADEDEYQAYGKSDSRFARYDPESGEVVTWNTRLVLGRAELATAIRLAPDRVTTLTFGENQAVLHLVDAATHAYTPDVAAVLARACWRQYLERRAFPKGLPALPAWLEQGLAEHFATAAGDAGGQYHTGLNAARVRELGWLMLDGDTRPLSQLLLPDGTEPAFDVGPAPAAQGWSLIHFLMESEDPNRSQLVPKLMAEVARSGNYKPSAVATFSGLDVAALQAEWWTWASSLRSSDPLAELARDYGDKIRPDQLSGDEDLKKRYGFLWRHRKGPQPGGSP